MSQPTVPDADWLWANEPCRAACPVHTDAGAYVVAIAEGRFADAYGLARRSNPFPSICGRVCAAPCETACRRGKVDAPVSIRALKRFVAERFGVESFAGAVHWHEGHGPVPPVGDRSVAVVGGGPGGLAAAHDLRMAGHAVTVYEGEQRLGGMMVHGIPEYRLPRTLIERETEAIIDLGIDVVLGCRGAGVDVTFDALLERHDAVFVAVGASRGRDLDIPGHDLDGVLRAVEFLLNVNRGFHVELGKRVVVIGGGNVAFDVARSALRAAAHDDVAPAAATAATSDETRRGLTTTLDAARAARRAGVEHVTVVALESFAEMPAAREEIEEAEAEGITIRYRRGPHRVVGTDRVTGLETVEVLSVFDDAGRFAPVFAPESVELVEADTVILAVGQAADTSFVPEHLDIERTRGGGIAVHGELQTTHPRVWAGGDVAFGPRNLIDAIADGRRAAAAIDRALRAEATTATPHPRAIALHVEPSFRRLATGYDAIDRVPVPTVATDRRVGFGEVETGYDEGPAVLEALRCLRCFDNIMLDTELCILCGLCVDVCPFDCISIVRADTAGLGTTVQSALLLDEELCIRCGLCVNRCPPSALTMVNAKEVAVVTDVLPTDPPSPVARDGLEPDVYPVPESRWARVRHSELARSVFRHPHLDTPRGRALQGFSNVFLHVYPVKVPARVLRYRYSWRLGYIATVLFGILVTTGVYLMFFYTPSVSSAYGDMQQLRTGVGFGQLVRNVHRWSAHLMVLVVLFHLVRVFLAGAYKRPRQFNWVLGMVLLVITLGFSFTGYLLPWDQLSYWAVTVGTNLVNYVPLFGNVLRELLIGGEQIGQTTLQRFYALHVAVLPVSLVMVLMVHIWRVRKDGFAVRRDGTGAGAFAEQASSAPVTLTAVATAATADADGKRVRVLGVVDRQSVTAEARPTDDTVFTWPHLLVRHVVVGLGVVATVLALGVAFAAPLRGLANPNLTPEPAKAPWYFVGLQELLAHFDPLVAGILIPTGALTVLTLLPYIDRNPATEARRRKVAICAFVVVIVAAVTLTVIGLAFRGPGWKFVPPWRHSYIEL